MKKDVPTQTNLLNEDVSDVLDALVDALGLALDEATEERLVDVKQVVEAREQLVDLLPRQADVTHQALRKDLTTAELIVIRSESA